MRKLVLIALGTLGDTDPLLAIGASWRKRNFDVVVGTSENLCRHVQQQGFKAYSICGDLSGITANPLPALIAIRRSLAQQESIVKELAKDTVAVVGAGFPYIAPTIADYTGAPYIYAVLSPAYIPESGLLPYIGKSAPSWLSRLGWAYQKLSNDTVFGNVLNKLRAELGLNPVHSVFQQVFQPSRKLLAFPPEVSQSIAKAQGVFAPGFLQRPIGGSLPSHVEQFFERGPAPLVLALGSSRVANVRELVSDIIAAAEKCGLPTMVASSWSDREIGELPIRVGRSPAVPYGLLFERAAVVVHHGGAGTFALALRAGKPQVTLPGFADQTFWANQAFSLGVAPRPVPRRKATRERLLERIREASTDPGLERRARELSRTNISANGSDAAAEWLQSFVD